MEIDEKAGWWIAAAILLALLMSVRPWRARPSSPAPAPAQQALPSSAQ